MLTTFTSSLIGEIITVSSFKEIDFENLHEDSLVIFDVDEVLITSEDRLLSPAAWNYAPLIELVKANQEPLSIALASTSYHLVDPSAPALIDQLIEKKIPTIALTKSRIGKFGVIPSFEDWRFDQLARLNIHFDFHANERLAFLNLVSDLPPPIFAKGILFCGDFNPKNAKGVLLNAFLERINWRPKYVIFIDDQLVNLEGVSDELARQGVDFTGYFFQAHPYSLLLDEEVAELQLKTLYEKKKWLSDKEAEEKLSKFRS